MRRLRLLKVVCQPIFVIDDGETLVEQPADPVVVAAGDWPTFANTGFAESFETLRRAFEDGTNEAD